MVGAYFLVGTVNDRYVLLVFGFTVACSTRRASMHADVLPRLLRDDGNPPKLCKRHIVVLCLVAQMCWRAFDEIVSKRKR